MIDLYIDVKNKIAVAGGWNPTRIPSLDLRAGDTPVFNLYFVDPMNSQRAPFSVRRYQSAAISMQLLDSDNIAQATQNTWTEIVPAVTAPTLTRVASGSGTVGEYDRITLASTPGSGSFTLVLSAGTITAGGKGASSASIKVYPGQTSPNEIAAAFAAMAGAPWSAAFISPTIIDVHGNAILTGTSPRITECNVSDLQYLYGWTASLALTGGAGVTAAADFKGDTPQVTLLVKLTPSGGAAETMLKLPINLYS